MKKKTVAIVSLGCSKNLVDSEVMLGVLGAEGYVVGATPEEADIILVNTCAFIRDAVEESGRVLDEMASLRREGQCGKLVVAGCLPQREGAALRKRVPEIDLLIGASSYSKIAELIKNGSAEDFAPLTFLPDHKHPRLPTTPPWTAYLKVAEGCSNRCSYCLIPSLRGDYRSRQPDDLLREAENLATLGVKELVLVAQDTTRYGTDLDKKTSLAELLKKLSEVEDIRWLRVMYAYPELVDEALVRAIAGLPKVCNYIDIPIQHIDPDILKAMNRRGGPGAIRNAIDSLRSEVPGLCIRTTVMVGFPGETDAQFDSLLCFIEETRFDRLGAFSYSPEEGTAAASMPGQVPDEVKQERLDAVMRLQQDISLEINQSLIGKTFEVLVEENETDEDGESNSVGRSYRDAPEIDGVFFLDGEEPPGTFVSARVTGASEYDLRGE